MKKIGIGYESYKRIVDDNCYYVDKTLLVRDVIDNAGMVTLFTRPRRFGKTLALSMLQTFFEEERDSDGNIIDNSHYFDGMKIMDSDKDILDKMGKYPVIRLSLKSAKQPNFETAFLKLKEEICGEFERHGYLKKLMGDDREQIEAYEDYERGVYRWNQKVQSIDNDTDRRKEIVAEYGKYATALKTLAKLLKKYHGRNAIILIDEYDVPLENAYQQGFYDEMIAFIRSLFESALKTNDALGFAIVTGCLRISKESIFTGLNNLEVNSIRSRNFGEYFGFTGEETMAMLDEYNLSENADIVRSWYDGYLFGECEVYNPWSVTKYVKEHYDAPEWFPEGYWSNTSSNAIIKRMVYNADDSVKAELDILISGGTIEKPIHEDITYDDIDKSQDNLWNFLYFTGYMKKISERQENDDIYITMAIPNKEVAGIYRNQIKEWFNERIKTTDYSPIYDAIIEKNVTKIEEFLCGLLSVSISYFDSEESFYHGFLLSLLYGMPGYTAKSNRESGNGRPDIVLYPDCPKDPAYIFEIKSRKKFNEMGEGLTEAFEQIYDKKYEEGVIDDGYIGAVSFGICFCKKSCIVGLYSR